MQNEPVITNQQTALKLLIQGVNLAQSRGAFNLSEAALLDKCIKIFRQPSQQIVQPNETVIRDEDDKVDNLEVENIQI